MDQLVDHGTHKRKWFKRYPLIIMLTSITVLMVIIASILLGDANRHQPSTVHSTAPSSTTLSTGQCSPPSSSQWTPVGSTWKLTVSFLTGSRKGQSEASVMTFLPSGGLTATFPGSTPALPPAIDGGWCMTGFNTFHYQFKDPLVRKGDKLVLYVATNINAYMTSKTTFDAGGVGVAYSALTGKPGPGQYNVTVTSARAS